MSNDNRLPDGWPIDWEAHTGSAIDDPEEERRGGWGLQFIAHVGVWLAIVAAVLLTYRSCA